VEGVLKGYDPLLNLVLDETKEFLRGAAHPWKLASHDGQA
jgi:small nuclear ribonucleoprotein (snRNP)-like protein